MTRRRLHLNVNGNGVSKPARSWQFSEPHDWFLDFSSWEQLGRIAERGKFDAVFLADLLGKTDFSRPWHAFDPFMLQVAVARATEHIGVIATLSATFHHPWEVARRAATLDLASGGRAGINIVTSGGDAAAALYGRDPLPEREARYARAGEVLTAVETLWDSWDPAAWQVDARAGRLTDEALIADVDFDGEYVGLRGRFQFPRSVQGRPVIVQAGASVPGIELAVGHADAVFCATNTLSTARDFYRNLKRRAAAHGRDPDSLLVLPGLNITLGGTAGEARARRAELTGSATADGSAVHALADQLDVPTELLALDRALPWEFLDSADWRPRSVGAARAVLSVARKDGLTVREIIERRAHEQNAFVGTPEQVASEIETWFTTGAADGFNINFDTFPTGLEHIVDHLVPELQRRGIFRNEYETSTLRGHYGLPVPGPERFAPAQEAALSIPSRG